MTTACLGGWCSARDNCRHHLIDGAARQREPEERLCDPRSLSHFSPVHDLAFHPQAEALARPNSVFDLARIISLEAV